MTQNSRTRWRLHRMVGRLLSVLEQQADFWPNARHFHEVGEDELAFEGLYPYLLERPDLWKQHHALIKKIKPVCAGFVDFDRLDNPSVQLM